MVGCWTFVAAGFFPFCVGLRAADMADLAVVNAQIYTVDPQQQSATAIAVKGGKILAIGDDVSQFIGPDTQKIDARGKTIVPGFIDSHGHVLSLGQSLTAIDLRGVRSESEAAQRVAAAVRSKTPGEWIIGNAWDQNLWPSKNFPAKQSLDQVAPTNPVVLSRVDGHAVWINSAALKIASITSNSRDPQGGRILRDASREPTGVLVDQAQSLINSKIPPPASADIENALKQAAQLCSSFGLTTVHDAGIDAPTLAAYRILIAKGQLPLRVYAMIRVADAGALWRAFQSSGPEIGDFLTIRSLKLYADGALGSRGAALLEPYSDDPGNRGLLISSRELIEKVARDAIAAGFQVNTHAIGDRANRTVLEAYAAALGNQKNDKRFRVEHAQVVAAEDFGRFRDNSIIASMQPTHATSDMPWAAMRIGPERIRGAYACQTFRKLGVRLAFGSDFPVESPNPIWGFYAAITRQDRDGNPPGGWFPEQRLTRAEALRAFTIDGAYAAFEERRKGSLVPGKLADFVMLSDDIMRIPDSQVWRAQVLMTVLDGKIVYRRPGE